MRPRGPLVGDSKRRARMGSSTTIRPSSVKPPRTLALSNTRTMRPVWMSQIPTRSSLNDAASQRPPGSTASLRIPIPVGVGVARCSVCPELAVQVRRLEAAWIALPRGGDLPFGGGAGAAEGVARLGELGDGVFGTVERAAGALVGRAEHVGGLDQQA